MIVLSVFLDHIGRLVHADARSSELLCARHRSFIATRLGLFLAAIITLPVGLACGHVPAAWEAFAAVWFTVPLGAAAYVSRTARIERGELACLMAWIGFAVTATLGGGTSLGGGMLLLLLAPIDATFADEARFVRMSLAASAISAAALAGVAAWHPAGPSTTADVKVIAPALVYLMALAMASAALRSLHQHLHVEEERRYRILSEAIGDLVLRYNRTAGVLAASRDAEQLFGIKPRTLQGRGLFERVHVADRPVFLKLFSDAAVSAETVSARIRLRTGRLAPGENGFDEPVFAWIELRTRRLDGAADPRGGDSDPTIVAIVRDVTAEVRQDAAIRQARDEAERASAWKDGFLANVSHELRTPLNAIIGFSEILSNEEFSPRDPAKRRDYAQIITTSGEHLLSVVNSLLDLSKIEAGCFAINPEPFDVAAMIGSCCDMIGLKAEQAGVAVSRDLSSSLNEIVGDKRACKQIVINLLSNALKFTPNGGQIAVGMAPQGTSVLITVVDTGVGIAHKDLCRLGDAFFQGQAGFDRPYEGTGLGLSVVRGLVGLHGGAIAVESAPGQGTRVSVRLPLDCRTAPAQGATVKIETIPRYARPIHPVGLTETMKVQEIA